MPRPDTHTLPEDARINVEAIAPPYSSSSRRPRSLNPTPALAAIIFVVLGMMSADAAGAFEFRVLEAQPVAVRGGVLRLTLETRSRNEPVPDTIPVRLDNGRILVGYPAAFVPRPALRTRVWTEEPRGLEVQSLQGQTLERGDQFSLFIPLPVTAEGTIVIQNQRLSPIWCDRPSMATSAPASLTPADRRIGYTVPDPHSPFAAWRRWMLADRRGESQDTMTTGRFSELALLVAEHETALWQVGLSRLRGISPVIATEVQNVLTAICRDAGIEVAVWLTDPAQAATLLDVLLDFDKPEDLIRAEVQAWLDAQSPMLAWVVWNNQQEAHLVLANPLDKMQHATVRWLRQPSDHDMPPLALELPPGVISRVFVPRPAQAVSTPDLGRRESVPPPDVLEIMIGTQRYLLVADQPREVASPPGAFFHRLRAPLRLWELRAGTQQDVPDAVATFVHLRRLNGRWELFIEARRPAATSNPTASIAERLTIMLGQRSEAHEADVILQIPETGWHEVVQGPRDTALQVHRRSLSDRWYCRVVLPSRWIETALVSDAPLAIGVRRTSPIEACHDHCAPQATVPWQIEPGRSLIDLTRWDAPLRLWR